MVRVETEAGEGSTVDAGWRGETGTARLQQWMRESRIERKETGAGEAVTADDG